MKPQNTLKGLLIVVMLVLNTAFGFSQSPCDLEDPYINQYHYSIPSFIHSLTNSRPGSSSKGVPPSENKHVKEFDFILVTSLRISSVVECSLRSSKSWGVSNFFNSLDVFVNSSPITRLAD